MLDPVGRSSRDERHGLLRMQALDLNVPQVAQPKFRSSFIYQRLPYRLLMTCNKAREGA